MASDRASAQMETETVDDNGDEKGDDEVESILKAEMLLSVWRGMFRKKRTKRKTTDKRDRTNIPRGVDEKGEPLAKKKNRRRWVKEPRGMNNTARRKTPRATESHDRCSELLAMRMSKYR